MDITTLLQLYSTKDSKRKRALFQFYEDIISMPASLSFIAKKINDDLGKDVISVADIKYARYQYVDKNTVLKKSKKEGIEDKPKITKRENPNFSIDEITFTDPDEIEVNSKSTKSKFYKHKQ